MHHASCITEATLTEIDRYIGFQEVLEVARFKGFNPIVKTLDDTVQEEFKDTPKDKVKVMDAGAGTGLVGVELHKFGFTTIDALDISPGMLNEAKKKNVYKKSDLCCLRGSADSRDKNRRKRCFNLCWSVCHYPCSSCRSYRDYENGQIR